MVIWGGQGKNLLFNDFYQYNVLTNEWTLIVPQGNTLPSARMGACIGVDFPIILIYGGQTASSLVNEIWKYDAGGNTYTLVSPNNLDRSQVINPYCEIVSDKYNNILFFVMNGITTGEQPVGSTSYFNLTDQTWTIVFDPELASTNRAIGIQKLLGNKVITIGGETWGNYAYQDVLISDDTSIVSIGKIPAFIYGSGYAYYKTSIFSYGGGATVGSTVVSSSTELFYQIDLSLICSVSQACEALCSKGTYFEDLECQSCAKGSYSESISDAKCTLCPAGTYNENIGANTNQQCYPCSYGTYSSEEGSVRCLECPYGKTCPTGSKTPFDDSVSSVVNSVQPPIFSAESAEAIYANYVFSYTILSVSMLFVILLKFSKFTKKLKMLDLFRLSHNYDFNIPLKLKKTECGGVFSVAFLILAMYTIVSAIIVYILSNTQESKTLVPLVILESEISEFKSLIYIQVVFNRYGGSCISMPNVCNSNMFFKSYQIKYSNEKLTCFLSSDNDCVITYTCKDCTIDTGAYFEVVLSEQLSYASGISVNFTTDSSIPNAISSYYTRLTPPENTVFRGYQPSVFYFTATPSLFKHELGDPNPLTGYHISSETAPSLGSYYFTSQLPFTSSLKLEIDIFKSSSSLYTLRYLNETFIIAVNALLGSVFGIMGAIGAVMKITEGSYVRYKKKREKRLDKNILKAHHKNFKNQCKKDPNNDKEKN